MSSFHVLEIVTLIVKLIYPFQKIGFDIEDVYS